MKIEISSFKDLGDKEKERVILSVNEDTELGDYIISVSVYNSNDTISSSIKNNYWLPNQKVKVGDLIVIYTKKGVKKKVDNEDGSTSYFYYWNLPDTLQSIKDSTVVLFETSWAYKKVKPEIKKADEYIEE